MLRILQSIGFLCAFAIAPAPAHGTEAKVAFTELLSRVAVDHPAIVAASQVTKAGAFDVAAARSAMRPQLGIEFDSGLTGGTFAVLPEARVSQLVYDGGRTPSEIRRRRIRVDRLGLQEQAVLAQLSSDLAVAWISHSRAIALLEISRAQVAALDELQGLVVQIASFDRGRSSDVVMVQSRLQQAVTTMQSREIAVRDAADTVREVAALAVEPAGDVPDMTPFLPQSEEDCAELAATAPRVLIADLQVTEGAEVQRGARHWWMPRVALEGARTSEVDAQGDTRLFNDFALRLRVSALPFDSGGGRARLTAAADPSADGEYRQAGSGAVLAKAQDMARGPALSADEERQAIARGWNN